MEEGSTRVPSPWPAKVCCERLFHWSQVGRSSHAAVVDGDPGVLVGTRSALSGDGDKLFCQVGLSGQYCAILKNNSGITEYEIDGAVNLAVSEELAIRVNVESVLVTLHAATVEHRFI